MLYTIKRPILTEKTSALAETGIYAFEVDTDSTKSEIKSAVEKFFRVRVVSVNTSICRKRKKATRSTKGSIRYWKRAIVKLAPGEKISVFEGA
jgi:large subunit ribosomal protein L23